MGIFSQKASHALNTLFWVQKGKSAIKQEEKCLKEFPAHPGHFAVVFFADRICWGVEEVKNQSVVSQSPGRFLAGDDMIAWLECDRRLVRGCKCRDFSPDWNRLLADQGNPPNRERFSPHHTLGVIKFPR